MDDILFVAYARTGIAPLRAKSSPLHVGSVKGYGCPPLSGNLQLNF